MPANNQYQKIVPFILFALALLLLFKLVKPMITVLLSSVLISYISFPVYKKLVKKIHNKSVSIILSLLIISIIVLIPFVFLVFEFTQEGYYFYNSLSSNIEEGALFGYGCTSEESKVCSIVNQVEKFSLERLSAFGFDTQLQKLMPILEEKITKFILSIPIIIAMIFLTLVISYFIMKDWKNLLEKIAHLLPMRKKTIKKLVNEFGLITYTIVYAQLFVALVQGIVATIGFYIFGVPFPIVLGVVVAFFALIPAVGTALIWAPISLFLILSGYLSHDYSVMGRGIGLFLYGLFIISTIDNLLLAKIANVKAKVNQIVVIIGVIGGAVMFGVVGIFILYLFLLDAFDLSLLITYFKTFKERFN